MYADVDGKFKRRLDDKVIDKYTYINTYIEHAMPLFASQSLAGRVTVRYNASGFCIAYRLLYHRTYCTMHVWEHNYQAVLWIRICKFRVRILTIYQDLKKLKKKVHDFTTFNVLLRDWRIRGAGSGSERNIYGSTTLLASIAVRVTLHKSSRLVHMSTSSGYWIINALFLICWGVSSWTDVPEV